jgi:hypothetical protein
VGCAGIFVYHAWMKKRADDMRKMRHADADVPVKYMDRTRHYYRALGYTRDYIWATFNDVPFSQLAKPLSESRIV